MPEPAGPARRWWARAAATPLALRTVVGYAALIGALELLLRHNAPPPGELVFGALIGLLYAMLAFGLILIYRANRVINFAQAEMGSAAAILGVLLIKLEHVPYLLALLATLVAAVLSGLLADWLVVRRFASSPRLVLSVATIGLALVFSALQLLLPGWIGGSHVAVSPSPPRTPFSNLHLSISPLTFDANSLVILVAAVVVVVGLNVFFRRTPTGMAVRAAAENADRARLLAVPVERLSTLVWVIAAVLSALSVFLRVPVIGIPIGVDVGPQVLIYALAAAVIARMESFPVALVAAVAIGVTEQSLYYFSHDPAIPQAVMLPVLLGAMISQRHELSRGEDTGIATWRLAREFKPIPPELSRLPEVAWGRVALGGLVALGALILPYVVPLEQQILASVVVVYGLVAISLVVLTGWAGQISLGQWGLAGIGAEVAGIFSLHLSHSFVHGDFFVALLAAGLGGAVAAVVIGLPALRIQGLYLAVTTLAFGIAVQVYLLSPNYFSALLPTGLQTIGPPVLYGRYSLGHPRAFYYFCLIILALALLSASGLRRSRSGRTLLAVRDNERGARSYGVSVATARLWAFAISGFWAAIAGALYAFHESTVQPLDFDPNTSLLLLIIVVIGGVTSLQGALLGTAFIGVVKYGGLGANVQTLASGVGVLLLLYIAPGGLAQVLYGSRDGLLRRIAERRGLIVPSLVADRSGHRDEEGTVAPSPEEVLAAAGSRLAARPVAALADEGDR